MIENHLLATRSKSAVALRFPGTGQILTLTPNPAIQWFDRGDGLTCSTFPEDCGMSLRPRSIMFATLGDVKIGANLESPSGSARTAPMNPNRNTHSRLAIHSSKTHWTVGRCTTRSAMRLTFGNSSITGWPRADRIQVVSMKR